jgi:hypothetical protein
LKRKFENSREHSFASFSGRHDPTSPSHRRLGKEVREQLDHKRPGFRRISADPRQFVGKGGVLTKLVVAEIIGNRFVRICLITDRLKSLRTKESTSNARRSGWRPRPDPDSHAMVADAWSRKFGD